MNRKSIIVLSVPRSGTHLVMKDLHNKGYIEWYAETNKFGLKNIFNMPKTGHYCFGAHLNSRRWYDSLTKSELDAIYISRNPRDVAVSLAEYIGDRALLHPNYKLLNPLSMNERIELIITGNKKPRLPSLNQRISEGEGWKKHPSVTHVTFEDLVEDKNLSGSKEGEKYFQNYRKGIVGDWKNYKDVDWQEF